jgi:glycosyltransferase involved in cell wall biosynthesis
MTLRDRAKSLVQRLFFPDPGPPLPFDGRPALVIPVKDDAAGLARALAAADRLGVFAEILVVDDGSTPPVALPPAATPAATPAPGRRLIRHRRSRGGGVARNRGLACVTAPYVMFLDADDLPTAALPRLLADLAKDSKPFDLCIYKYADSRLAAAGRWGQPDWDETFWQEAGAGLGALAEIPPAARPILAQTANYPWNKIYRTAFLRQHRIGCAPTPVHQDIPLHWLAFALADRVLVSDRICIWHQVAAGGNRLTNRRGADRLSVFAALNPVADRLAQADPAWQAAFARFVPGLMGWIAGRIDPALLPAFQARAAAWQARRLPGWGQR